MKNFNYFAPLLVGAFTLTAAATEYRVKITNLTRGQPISPPLLVAHSGKGLNLFKLGTAASEGLWKLAENGDRSSLEAEVSRNSTVAGIGKGSELILPGQTSEISLRLTAGGARYLALASMIARTNDGFTGANALALPQRPGYTLTYLAGAYDAGSEKNNESCAFIPAPPCNSPGVRDPNGAEGFVHPHPGVQGGHDLDTLRDVFAGAVEKIEITRVH